MDKKRQLVFTIFLSRVLFFGLGISNILTLGGNFNIISAVLGYILGYIILNIFLKKDNYHFFKSNYGKYILIFICIFLLNDVMVAFSVLTSNFYLITTPPILIILSICILFLYASKKEVGALMRFSDFLIIISILIYIFLTIFLIKNLNIGNLLPIKIDNEINVIKAVFSTAIYSTIPILLLLSITDSIDILAIKKGYLISGISIILILVGIISVFGINLSNAIRYPEYILLKKISVLSLFENLENFLSIIWFNDLVITGCLCVYTLRKQLSNKMFYILFILEVILCYKVFIGNYQNILFLFNYSFYILLICFIIVIIPVNFSRFTK